MKDKTLTVILNAYKQGLDENRQLANINDLRKKLADAEETIRARDQAIALLDETAKKLSERLDINTQPEERVIARNRLAEAAERIREREFQAAHLPIFPAGITKDTPLPPPDGNPIRYCNICGIGNIRYGAGCPYWNDGKLVPLDCLLKASKNPFLHG